MKQLTEAQFDLLQHYLNMANCIEDGFVYVVASFTDFSKTEADLVFTDIVQALRSITEANPLLESIVGNDESVQQAIIDFREVMDAAFKLEGNFDDYATKMKIVNQLLYPAFSKWKDGIEYALIGYIVQ